MKTEAKKYRRNRVVFSDLLACVECKTRPMEETMREGGRMVTVLQCQYDCETVIGPKMWARREWNRFQKDKQANGPDQRHAEPPTT